MKKKSQHFLLGKTATGLIAVLLLAGTVFAWNLLDSAVYAEADTVAVETVEDVAYKVESHTDINAYRQNGNFTAPTYSGEDGSEKWLFAGWYTDKECTKSLSQSIVAPNAANGTYYAKYAKKEVLSVRCQVKDNTNIESENTVLRFVSSVDSLKYQSIGLELVTPDGSVKKMHSQKVGTKINARKDIIGEYTYSPKAIGVESEYFFSATEQISNSDFGKGYLVKPYWITQDGTCVYGVSKYVTVNQGIGVDKKIYIPVKMEQAPAEDATFTANGTRATCVKYDENGGYAHLALTDVPTASATKYEIKDASSNPVGSYIYRNMTTAYKGVADSVDTSWYDVYAGEGESKFVIATSADLYGLATIVNDGNNLKDKTVYVVSDIDTNDEAKSYVWTRIGDRTNSFSGTFDGCMHSIKNIRMTSGTTTAMGQGFFGAVNKGAVLKNFKLVGGKYTFGVQQAGSVVGVLQDATLDTVYSNAYVEGSYDYLGGLIGNKNTTGVAVVTNCWFDGTVNQISGGVDRKVGGLLGGSNYNVELSDCLNTAKVSYGKFTGKPNSKGVTGALGGLVGQAGGKTEANRITINNCMNIGTITPNTEAETNFGGIVGDIVDGGMITINRTYATTDSCSAMVDGGDYSETTADVKAYTAKNLTGVNALTQIPNLFKSKAKDGEYDYRWVVVAGSTPVLRSFASETGKAIMGVDTSWYDVDGIEYVLRDAADLYGFALLSGETNFEGKTIKLGADIAVNSGNAKEWAETAPDFEWIGINNDSNFAGTFDGQGHTIRGLYVATSDEYRGMFGGTVASAVIRNFSLRNSYFKSTKGRIGSIAGRGIGTFDTIYSDAIIEATGNGVGGFLGQGRAGTVHMNNCWFAGSVTNNFEGEGTSKSKNNGTGGLIGNLLSTAQGIVTNCLNTGTITAPSYTKRPRVGGLIGAVQEGTSIISNCVNAGTVSSNGVAGYGALAGRISGAPAFNNCYAIKEKCSILAVNGELSSESQETSKLVLQADAMGTNALTKMPALFQYNAGEKNYWSMTAEGTPVLTSFADTVESETLGFNTSWYDESKSTYVLQNEADLYGFAALSKTNNFEEKTIKLANDIEVNKEDASNWDKTVPAFAWNEIGTNALRFKGTFDGQGHTIKGLYQNTSGDDKGLFAVIENASVSNLRLTNSYFESTSGRIGSIAGRGSGVFENIYSDAIVVGNGMNIGGLLGQSVGPTLTLTNCWFAGSVTNKSVDKQGTGGLIGNVTVPTSLTDCLNTGTVSAEAYNTKATVKDENGTETETEDILPRVGGLIGNVQENISCTVMTSLNTGEVKVSTATEAYGSVIGRTATPETVTVSRTYATQESCVHTGVEAGVTTVYQSEMVGVNARTVLPGLFDTNTRWTTIENGAHPVLSTFQDYAKVAENSSLLLWLRGKDSHTVTLANPVALSTGTWDAKKVGAQGGYTDGHYFYQAYITEQAYNQDDTRNDSNNKCHIIKQDLTGQEDIVISEELLLGHANDITYDSVNNRLVMYTRGNNLMFLDPNTLGNLGTYNLGNGISFSRMAYNASTDSYLVSLPSLANKNIPFKFLNSEFETVAGPFNSNTNTFSLTGQGASCDEQYIYLLYWDKSTKTENVIAVYDWNGNFVTSITLRTNTDAVLKEAENISVVNNTIYVMINETTTTQGRGHAEHKYVYSFCIE